MRVRFVGRKGYGDRFGVFHEAGSVAEMPDAIAQKLIVNGIAQAEPEPEPVAEPEPPRPTKPKTRK